MAETKTVKEEKITDLWIREEVPTQTTEVLKNASTGEVITYQEAISKILNLTEQIKKQVVG